MDVAKAKLDCCLLLDEASGKRKTKIVKNTQSGIIDLLAWVAKQNVSPKALHIVMEATGIYHEQAAMALADAGVMVSIINPAQIKDFGRGLAVRTKTDGVDSVVLARYGALLKPKAWVPPPQEARVLQALLVRREAIAQDLQRERNRQEKAHATDTPALIHKSLKESIGFLVKQLAQLQKDIDEHIDQHSNLQKDRALLQSIPAIGPQVGSNILSVMHNHDFGSAEQLAAYLGLVPVERQSGSSVLGRARMSKAGSARIRAVLYMAAVVGTRYNPHVKAIYERLLARGKSKMSSLGAAMRKLVHLCFGVLKTQQPYQHDYLKNA
ncbi:IS110 family transposase [Candidatus Nitrotoga sp. AM1P]|uniref:IS110 family transposase n=1 Tax=Candidatus Nitrotoga sp. AM1P TaxID=2559597 RepID=UPI0010B54D4B|nr:IS110 family transposase [Candidatus Nitrotoga sp. AM1P]BBJ23298.1 IS110 family transposase [Candidatus Nitrotoga sp. AM1P]